MSSHGHDPVLAEENARLAASLRRIRQRLDSALDGVERGARQSAGASDGDRVTQLEHLTADLVDALADAREIATRRDARQEETSRALETERMSPPLSEVIAELRKR